MTNLETVVDAYLPYMRRLAQRILRNRHDAEDAVSQALEEYILEQRKLDEAGSEAQHSYQALQLKSYLLKRVKDRALDLLSSRKSREGREGLVAADLTPPSLSMEGVQLLESLPPELAYAAWCVYVEGAMWRDVAAELGMTEGALKMKLHRQKQDICL